MSKFAPVCVLTFLLIAAPPATAQDRVIKFWHPYTQPQRAEEMKRSAAEFERANPGTKVQIEIVPWAKIHERWRAAQAAGELPDVGLGNPPDYLDMWQAGAIHDVEDVVASLGGDKRFVPGLLDRHVRFQGKTLAVPHYMHALVLLYRKDLLREKGLTPPATWDDLLRVATALNAPPDRHGLQQLWGRGDWIGIPWMLYPLMRSNGGEFFDADGRVAFNTPENVEAVRFLVRLYQAASSSSAFDLERNKDQIEVLSKGKTALDLGTLYAIPELEGTNPAVGKELVATYPPQKKQAGWFTFANSLVLFKGKNPAGGKKWIAFLLEEERYRRFLHSIPGAMMPVLESTTRSKEFWDHPFFQKHRDEVKILQEGVVQGSFPGASRGLNANIGLLVESKALPRMLEAITKDKVDVEKAVALAQKELEADLAKLQADREERKIDALVGEALKTFQVPGAGVAVVRNDRVIYLKGHGVRVQGGKEAVTPDTMFPIASVTKSFTAASVALMVDDGKMTWDDPVRKHLDYFRLGDPAASEQATLRDLLCHRTGLSPWHDVIGFDSPWGREELIRRVGRVKLDKPFRSTFQYENLMYTTAGQVVGAVTKGSWEEVVQKRLFNPLGMSEANFSTELSKNAANHATPHRKGAAGVTAVPWVNFDAGGGAGAIKAHTRDMTKWVRFQLGDGTFEGKRILSSAQLREQHSPQMVIRGSEFYDRFFPDASAMTYGLGWHINDYRGHTLVWHGGNIDGWSTQVYLVPKSNLGIVLLANLDETPMQFALPNSLLDQLLNLPEKNWNERFLATEAEALKSRAAAERKQEEQRHKNTKTSHSLDAYTGVYEDPTYGPVEISLKDGALHFQWTRLKSTLAHYHFDTFVTNKQDGPRFLHGQRILFGLGAEGDVVTLRFLEVEFKKVKASAPTSK